MKRISRFVRIVVWMQFLVLFASANLFAQTPFSLDSAAAYLRVIAVDIGPRTMGSPNERLAMEFAVKKFSDFGIPQAYVMTMKEFGDGLNSTLRNTQSGVAVAVLPGRTDRMIVVGAHIDSGSPEIAGANDDASGCAVVLELARVLSQRKNESTLVFALFGGEEQGMEGSRYFVEHFAQIDKVALMLQVDMANGSDWIMPLVDTETHCAPEWLVSASYEEFKKLGYTGLSFPSHFLALMSAMPGGGIGSDHQPFLEKNIPAIDFTSDPSDPVHTPQDNFENFKINGLQRSGDLVYRLIERFDGGVPEKNSSQYYLYQIGMTPIFVPRWAVRVFIIISIIITVFALLKVRNRRPVEDRATRPKIPGLKLFLMMLIIQTCVWFSENIVSFIKGVRHPWMASLDGYFILGFFAACLGIWISLQLAPRLRLRRDAYTYYLRAVIFLSIFLLLFALRSANLAIYPATALFFLSLAVYVRQPLLKLALWLISPYFMFRLFFSEGYSFLARIGYINPGITPTISLVLHLGYIVFFSIWAFPFLLGFASIYFDSGSDLLWIRRFRKRWGLAGAVTACVVAVVLLSREVSYSQYWKPSIRVEQTFDADSVCGSLAVRSSEYLDGTRIAYGSRDTTIQNKTTEFVDDRLTKPTEEWIATDRTVETMQMDSSTTFRILLKLRLRLRPYTLTLTYSGGKHEIKDVSTPFALSITENTLRLRWYSFPDTLLLVPIQFTVVGADSVTERIEASFVKDAVPVKIDGANGANTIRRTTISKQTVLRRES